MESETIDDKFNSKPLSESIDTILKNTKIKLSLLKCFPCNGYNIDCFNPLDSVTFTPIKEPKLGEAYFCCFKKGVIDNYDNNPNKYVDHVNDINSFQTSLYGSD